MAHDLQRELRCDHPRKVVRAIAVPSGVEPVQHRSGQRRRRRCALGRSARAPGPATTFEPTRTVARGETSDELSTPGTEFQQQAFDLLERALPRRVRQLCQVVFATEDRTELADTRPAVDATLAQVDGDDARSHRESELV